MKWLIFFVCALVCAVFHKDVFFASPTTCWGCLKIIEKFDEASRLIQLCTYLYVYKRFTNL